MSEQPNFQVLSLRSDGNPGRVGLQNRRYQVRKSHAKSRAGCMGCKVKRVKCDEGKPACRRCERNQTICIYRYPVTASPSTDVVLSQETVYTAHLPPSEHQGPVGSVCGTPRITLLHHFCTAFRDVYGLTEGGPEDFLALGLARPFLLDVMLAVAACHLRHHTTSASTYRVAEHYQQGLALRGFQSAMARPLDLQSSDALLMTAMMLNMLSFPLAGDGRDVEPEASWVYSADEQRCAWMTLYLGMKPLLMATAKYREDSCLRWMYEASDDESHSFSYQGLPLTHVPASWVAFFGLDEDDEYAPQNLFYEPVRILALVTYLPPGIDSFFLYVAFFGKVDTEFRTLVEGEDERAMWLLGFWFGLLSRYHFWWMRDRVTRDHKAILQWFRKRGEKAGRNSKDVVWQQVLHDLELAPYWKSNFNSSAW